MSTNHFIRRPSSSETSSIDLFELAHLNASLNVRRHMVDTIKRFCGKEAATRLSRLSQRYLSNGQPSTSAKGCRQVSSPLFASLLIANTSEPSLKFNLLHNRAQASRPDSSSDRRRREHHDCRAPLRVSNTYLLSFHFRRRSDAHEFALRSCCEQPSCAGLGATA
jgi:hypothetical protein